MPPKRSRKKPDATKTDCGQVRNRSYETEAGVNENEGPDHTVLHHPSLKLKQITERGCSAAMVDLQASFSNASDWLHNQKSKLKELIRETSGNKAVPRTPRRGITFTHFRETVERYSRSISLFENEVDEVIEHRGEGDTPVANREQAASLIRTPATVVREAHIVERIEMNTAIGSPNRQDIEMDAEPESSYEDAVCSINRDELNNGTDLQQGAQVEPVESSLQTLESFDTAVEGPILSRDAPTVKTEVISPESRDTLVPVCSQSHAVETPATSLNVKREIHSSRQTPQDSDVPCASSTATCERVTRSVAKKNAAMSGTSASCTRARIIAAVKNRKQTPVSSAGSNEQDEPVQSAAESSKARAPKVAHQHIVTTPCKREYKAAVQRVMDDQVLARNLSPKRPNLRTPLQSARVAPMSIVTTVTNHSQAIKKSKAEAKEALRREKEELAAQLREEQCKERAERIRKEREEKALRAQRRREQKEAEERRKAEARKQKEERDEQRREEIRIQKSPARSKAPSRVVSPARVPKKLLNNDVRPTAKMLFPSTPGRAPSKVARIAVDGGETSREPTMNTPTREVRRKPCSAAKGGVRSDDTSEDESISPRLAMKRLEITREERQRIMREEHERQERLREEERRRQRLDADGRQRHPTSGHGYVKMEIDEVHNNVEEQQRVASEDLERKRMLEEEKQLEKRRIEEEKERERFRIEQERREREQREAFLKEQESERQKLIAIQKKEAQKLLEEQARRVAEQEERLLREAQEEQKRRLREEQEEALKRLNISSSAELHNRHLENVSLNSPAPPMQTGSRHNSYEMTPDKVFKPSTKNNYNIEDLSSADETDDEEAPRKEVPPWAEGLLLQKAIEETTKILRSGAFDPDTFFREIFPPDLSKIFGTSKKFPRRGSSGIWDSPIGKPRQGVGAYRKRFNPRS
ncbi:hypothetical protein V3C99_010990 [Haemonchus contortus]